MARRQVEHARNRPLAEVAYAKLRGAIDAGRYRAGDRMPEADLAQWLGISRTPVRDALQRLESEGVLSAAPRRGLVVAQLEQQQISELYAVREVLEGLAGRLAAQHASAAEIGAMQALLQQQARTHADDTPTLARLNRLFHDVIYRATHNRYLINILDEFETSLALLPGTTYIGPGRARSALKEHTELVEAIEEHDLERSQQVNSFHIRAAERIRLQMISGALDTSSAQGRARHELAARAASRRRAERSRA